MEKQDSLHFHFETNFKLPMETDIVSYKKITLGPIMHFSWVIIIFKKLLRMSHKTFRSGVYYKNKRMGNRDNLIFPNSEFWNQRKPFPKKYITYVNNIPFNRNSKSTDDEDCDATNKILVEKFQIFFIKIYIILLIKV